ncbi:MAG TPA: hypothetical protein PKZ76_04465 [Xanthomonadaceae bacterium]|nr:hypothetical protein [Xanthomonadaceae bacterium]
MRQARIQSIHRLSAVAALACLLSVAPGATASANTFDLVCTTTLDRVEGTLADGSPVVASAVGEVRRYAFDLDTRRFASNGRVTAIHAVNGHTVVKADPEEIRSFGGVVHMQSEWLLDLESGVSVRKNRFYRDSSGSELTGQSEWHQRCERAPYTGMPAG